MRNFEFSTIVLVYWVIHIKILIKSKTGGSLKLGHWERQHKDLIIFRVEGKNNKQDKGVEKRCAGTITKTIIDPVIENSLKGKPNMIFP